VTGANSGIGYEVTRELWRRGACVYMLCRDRERGTAARQSLIDSTIPCTFTHAPTNLDPALLRLEIVDISRPREISAFATRVFGQDGLLATKSDSPPVPHLDMLVNNAGVLLNDRQATPDGIEAGFATNVLGTVHLTYALLPALRQSTGTSRVVTVSSGGAYNAALSCDDLESAMGKYDGVMAYARQKRAQIELTRYWAGQHPDVHFSVMHPGWASTPGVDRSLPGFAQTMKERLRSAAEGADTVVWLACQPRGQSGEFWLDRQVTRRHLWGAGTEVDESKAVRMDQLCREFVKSHSA